MESRCIVHFDLDTFFVSVEALKDNSLKGKPVAVGGEGDRAIVASCSYEARQFGVHSGMSMKIAKRLCPQLIVRRGDYDSYSKKSAEVTAIIKDQIPIVEKASIDEHYLDLTGFDRYFGSYKYTLELCQRITKETHLPISFGMASNKLVSKVATTVSKPLGRKQVEFGTERKFFSPLTVKRIPGVGNETGTQLALMGIKFIQDVYRLSPELLEATFGKHGLTLWERANAIDHSPVVPYAEQKSMSREVTFTQDTTHLDLLRSHLLQMVAELAFELRASDKMSTCITIKIRYSDFETHTQQRKIKATCFDEDLSAVAWELFGQLYKRRVLIRLIGVKFSYLIAANYQIDLFNDTGTHIALYQRIDKLRSKYGHDAVIKAGALPGIKSVSNRIGGK
jgi:DNA polymerase-4